jgi:hypothetical protein
MEDITVTERAKLWKSTLAVVAGMALTGCFATETRHATSPQPVYDPRTRQLVRLDWDANGNGRVDQRTYFANGVAARTEIDGDDDGRVDRWEYVDATTAVTHVGSSSANDGNEDTWTWVATAAGEVRIDRAQYRDRAVDRREFLLDAVLVRAEEDANRDGVIDKWETWKDGALVTASYDTTFANGRPDRRLVYDGGRLASIEADVDGTGRFERLLQATNLESGEKTRDRH